MDVVVSGQRFCPECGRRLLWAMWTVCCLGPVIR